MSISQTIYEFTTLTIQAGGWMEMDRIYVQNRLLALIGEDGMERVQARKTTKTSLELLDQLIEKAQENKMIGESIANKEILEAQIMDFLTPPPSVVNAFFAQHYANDPKEATDYFYTLSKENDYIKTRAIAKNIMFPVDTEYGELQITINLSKPEKDPKQIIEESKYENNEYPKCQLCMENEGYKGRENFPARANHRLIRMNLDQESWAFQYSPYAYYNEHAIVLSENHRPMIISRETFKRLMKIIEVLPHYFVGSNADLPIVGGSILSHDHYQAGRHTFPMEVAEMEYFFELPEFPLVNAGIVKWPMSVIRLQSPNAEDLVDAGALILEKWQNYSDDVVGVRAFSADGIKHHTVTPIARRRGNLYELDLVLRDNQTSEEYPEGIFHPHKDVQHIKKENIGLIEVMGLAVLPPRLATELLEVEKYVLKKENQIAEYHRLWADKLKLTYSFSDANVTEITRREVGLIFARVLADAGVFKRDEHGQQAFKRFIDRLK